MNKDEEIAENLDEDLKQLKGKYNLCKRDFLKQLLGYIDYQLDLGGELHLKSIETFIRDYKLVRRY